MNIQQIYNRYTIDNLSVIKIEIFKAQIRYLINVYSMMYMY